MGGLIRSIAPTGYPLSIAQLRDYLDAPADDRVDMLNRLQRAAARYIEGITWQALLPSTWVQRFDYDWPRSICGSYQITYGRSPVSSVSSVAYVDPDGANQGLAANQRQDSFNSMPSLSVPAQNVSWPSVRYQLDAITVTYVAGYATVADIPEPLVHAVGLLTRELYDNPQLVAVGNIVNEMPFGIRQLVWPFRVAR